MCGKGFTRWNFPAAKKALRAWIEAQRAALPPAEPLFTEDPARLDWMFFYIMFLCGPEGRYRGTAREVWLELKRI